MNLNSFLQLLEQDSAAVSFTDCIAVIDRNYHFTPRTFSNGEQHNPAGQNNGSCKIFAFGLSHQLTEAQVLACFGDYYRIDVLQNPDQSSHQNIRQFIQHGWSGIHFEATALVQKML